MNHKELKHVSAAAAAAVVLTAGAFSAHGLGAYLNGGECAVAHASETFTYESDGANTVITGVNATGSSITVPSYLGGTVTEIADKAFANTAFESIILPDTLLSIGRESFSGCVNLKSIVIPDKTTYIGRKAFYGCSSLASAAIPASVEDIGMQAFEGCADGFTIIGDSGSYAEEYAENEGYAFSASGEVSEITGICGENAAFSIASDGTLTISGSGAADKIAWDDYRNQITKVCITDGITSIPGGAFMGCSNLISVEIRADLACISESAFSECENLHAVNISGKIKAIEKYAFCSCTTLTSITLPEGIVLIDTWAFYNCTALSEISLPESLEYIGASAFSRTSLKKVGIGRRLTTIANNAFDSGSSVTLYGFNGTFAEKYAECNSIAFVGQETENIILHSGTEGEISWSLDCKGNINISGNGAISEELWNIEYPLSGGADVVRLDWIRTVNVSDGITALPEFAFSYREYIESVTLPDTLFLLNVNSFFMCNSELTFYAYEGTPLKASIEKKGYKFVSRGNAEEKVIFTSDNGDWNVTNLCNLTVTRNGIIGSELNSEMISEMIDYSDYIKTVTLQNAICVGKGIFWNFPQLEKVVFSEKIMEIDVNAFDKSAHPVIVGYSGSAAQNFAEEKCYTFDELGKLPLATLVSGDCGGDTHWSLDNAGTLHIFGVGEAVSKEWGDYKKYAKTISVENGITSIGSYLFYGLYAAETASLPDTLTEINEYAFKDCIKLTEISIPGSVVSMGSCVFYNCSDMLKIVGYKYSAASRYARSHGIAFESLGEMPNEIAHSGDCSGFSWTLSTHGELIINGSGSIDESPWKDDDIADMVESLVIGEGIDEIHWNTFQYCTNLTSVTLPDSIKKIWSYAFSNTGITEISLGSNIEYLGEGVFSDTKLESVVLPDTLREIPEYLFSGCKNLKSVQIPDSINVIEKKAFSYCTGLSEIEIPYTVMIMEDGCIEKNTKIKGYGGSAADMYAQNNGNEFEKIADVPNDAIISGDCGDSVTWKVTADGTLTISGAGEMKSYTYSNEIPWYDFAAAIKNINIENGITEITDYAFCQTAVSEVVIPESVTVIKSYAFGRCSNLSRITIPFGVTSISYDAFGERADNLTIVAYNDSAAHKFAKKYGCKFESLGEMAESVAYSGNYDSISWELTNTGKLTVSGSGSLTDYPEWKNYSDTVTKVIIGEGITHLDRALNYMNNLESVSLPATLEDISNSAFYNDYSLTNVVIPNGVRTIGSEAFKSCSKIESINLPESVISIGYSAFAYTGIKEITIPYTVTSIGSNVFSNYDSNITIKGYNGSAAQICAEKEGHTFVSIGEMPLFTVGEGSIGGVSWKLDSLGNMTLSGSGKLEISNKGTLPWQDNKNSIRRLTIGEGITSICSDVFNGCQNLVSVSFPDSVKAIGNNAFEDCSSLEEIVIGKGVMQIGEYAFSWALNLKKVTLPLGLKIIDEGAFRYTNITEITIPYTVSNISYNAFDGCDNLTVIGYSDTAAADFAANGGYNFTDLGEAPLKTVAKGELSSNASWELVGDGTLYLLGRYSLPYYADGSQPWADYRNDIKKVIVVGSIFKIGAYYFKDCANIESVVLSDYVESIYESAFENCTSLRSVTFGQNLRSIGSRAFKSSGLTTVVALCDTVGEYAFADCLNLKSAAIGTDVLSYAFSGCTNLESVTLSNEVESVGYKAFDGCSKLKTIRGYTGSYAEDYAAECSYEFESIGEIPLEILYSGTCGDSSNAKWTLDSRGLLTIKGSGVINNNGFREHKYKVKKLVLDGAEIVEAHTFNGFYKLKEIDLGTNIKELGYCSFADCSSLKEVVFPSSLQYLGYMAFDGCTSLEKITVPFELDDIYNSSFGGVPATMVVFGYEDSAAQTFAKEGGFVFRSLGTLERIVIGSGSCGENLTYEIDNYGLLKIVGSGAMTDYTEDSPAPWSDARIKTVELDDRITRIGAYAFDGVEIRNYASLPLELLEIGDYAFRDSFGEVNKLFLPNGLKKIGSGAYSGVYIGSVIAPATVESIGDNAFRANTCIFAPEGSAAQKYAENNDTIYSGAVIQQASCGNSASWNFNAESGILRISGTGNIADYKEDDDIWNKIGNSVSEIIIDEGITSIGKYALSRMHYVDSISLPKTLRSIGEGAFTDTFTDELVIPEGVTSIGANAFKYSYIDSLYLPKSLENIDDSAFTYCRPIFYVYSGSAAEQYMKQKGLSYELRDSGSDEPTPPQTPAINGVTAYSTASGVHVDIDASAELYGKCMIAALYNGDKLVDMIYVGSRSGFDFYETGTRVKVMCWETPSSLIPVTKSAEANVIEQY